MIDKLKQGTQFNYETLSLSQPHDSKLELGEQVMKAAFRKIKGDIQNENKQKDQTVEKQAQKLIQLAQKQDESTLSYNGVYQDLLNLNQYTQVKIALADNIVSGSSSDQLEPSYQSPEQVIAVAAGAPQILDFYIVSRIKATEINKIIQPQIKIITKWKNPEDPKLVTVLRCGQYAIYKITISSMIRKYKFIAKNNNLERQSNQIIFDHRQEGQLLFNKSFYFNFQTEERSSPSIFEQILLFLSLQQTANKIPKQVLAQVNQPGFNFDLPYNFTELIVKTEKCHNFYNFLMEISKQWKIDDLLPKQKVNIYRMLVNCYIEQKKPLFLQQDQNDNQLPFIKLMSQLMTSSQKNMILQHKTTIDLLDKLLRDIQNNFKNECCFILIQKMNRQNCILVQNNYSQRDILQKYFSRFTQCHQNYIAAQILLATYYYRCCRNDSHEKAANSIVEGITNFQVKLQAQNLKYFLMYVHEFFNILDTLDIQKWRLGQVLKLIKLYPLFKQFEKYSTCKVPANLGSKINRYVQNIDSSKYTKQTKQIDKTKKTSLKQIISIYKEVYLNNNISKYIYAQEEISKKFEKSFQNLLRNLKKIDDQDLLGRFNSQIFIQFIRRNVQCNFQEKMYVEIFNRKQRRVAFRILSEGATEQFFQKQQNQRKFDRILTQIISHHFKNHHPSEESPILSQYCNHVNQKILEHLLSLKKKGDKMDFDQYLNQLQKLIERQSLQKQLKQRLKALILGENLNFEPSKVKEYLKERQKIYFKLFLNIIERENSQRKNQLIKSLSIITQEIQNKSLSYDEVVAILPTSKKDIERLIKLFNKKIYQRLKEQQQYVQGKIEKIQKVSKFILSIKDIFKLNNEEINSKTNEIQQNLAKIKSFPISRIKQIQAYSQYSQNLLNMYHYPFFFDQIPKKATNIREVIQVCDEQVNKIIKKFREFIEDIKNSELDLKKYNGFKFDFLSDSQIKDMVIIYFPESQQNVAKIIIEIKGYIKMVKFYKNFFQSLQILTKNNKQFMSANDRTIRQIINFSSDIETKKQQKIPIKLFYINFQKARQMLDKLNVPLTKEEQESIEKNLPIENLFQISDKANNLSIILSIILLISKQTELSNLVKLQKYIPEIKDRLIDNFDSSTKIQTEDIQNYKHVILFYKTVLMNAVINGNIDFVIKELKNKSGKTPKPFHKILHSIILISNQFQDSVKNLKDENHNQKINIKNLVQNSKITIEINHEQMKLQIKVFTKAKQVYEEQTKQQLALYKGQACMIKNKAENIEDREERNQIIRRVDTFIRMHGQIQKIRDQYTQLLEQGYIIFQNIKQEIKVVDYNLSQLEAKSKQVQELVEKWIQNLRNIASQSSKITMFKGKTLKNLFNIINGQDNDYQSLRIIQPQQSQQYIKNQIRQFQAKTQAQAYPKPIKSNPSSCLNHIKQFFIFLVNKKEQKRPAGLNKKIKQQKQKSSIIIVKMNQEDSDYLSAVNVIDQDRVPIISPGQIISCKKDSTKIQMSSFIERAISDTDNYHFMLGTEKIAPQMQDVVTDYISDSVERNQKGLKLVMVGTYGANKIQKFIAQDKQLSKNTQTIQTSNEVNKDQKKFINFVKQRFNSTEKYGTVRIYTSSYPGLGKTYQIVNEIKKINKQTVFFPISGRTNSQKLYNRLLEKVSEKERDGKNKYRQNICLLIQLYEIQEQSVEVVNDFISKICFLRDFQYNQQHCILKVSTRIYIEIQDQRVIQSIPIIKKFDSLKKQFKDIFINFESFDLNKISITPHDIKLSYILQHLKAHNANNLDKVDLPILNEFKPKQVPQGKDLIKKYFVDRYPNEKKLNYYQFNYWVNLFYESCANFSNYIVINSISMKENYPSSIITKFKLEKLRSSLFQVLLQNSVKFLAFSVQNLLQSYQDSQNNKASKIEFIAIPNHNFSFFSFIYKQKQLLPEAIRSFYVLQTLLENFDINSKKTYQQLQIQYFKKKELKVLQNQNREIFQREIEQIFRNISGVNSYKMSNDKGYVFNIDNFLKICLISYKIKANIPLVIQGQAGIGKTALLRHLFEQVYKYQFKPFTINAGVTELQLKQKILEANELLNNAEQQNVNLAVQKKVCLFFDQFNTLPQLGYIKEAIMQHRFMGQSNVNNLFKKADKQYQLEENHFLNLIFFAACNPYRNKNRKEKVANQKNAVQNLAFTVKRPPIALGHIMWNFGALSDIQMNKYIMKMLSQIKQDLPQWEIVPLICKIQNYLNSVQFGSMSLRDIERFRQIYTHLSRNMPEQTNLIKPVEIEAHYNNLFLRAFFVSISMTYLNRLDSQKKINQVALIINEQRLTVQMIKKFKLFQQEDFASRLKINFQGISLNSSLKQNLYSIFVSIITKIPLLIIGSPGSSKSLATRIITDNFKKNSKHSLEDQWLKRFKRVRQFYFQGSQTCKSQRLQQTFNQINDFIRKSKEPIIPLFVFDEMGLAQKSPDNPLKAIHEPLELRSNTNKQNIERQMAFLGISNHNLDLSKMSRFLILRRAEMQLPDLILTAKQISKAIFKQQFNFANVQQYIYVFCKSYQQFLKKWKSNQGQLSQTIRNFFGLRDFYSLIRTFSDLIARSQNKNRLENVEQIGCISIFRNFSGFKQSYQQFLSIFKRELGRDVPQIKFDTLKQISQALDQKSRRYPLIIAENSIAQSIFCLVMNQKLQNSKNIYGSPFKEDLNDDSYISSSISKIVQTVKMGQKMVANQLNKTVEGALFDLFNKFFQKTQHGQYYRIYIDSAGEKKGSQQKVHPDFNAAIIIKSDQARNESSAFLNRFQKYEFSLSDIRSQSYLTQLNSIQQTKRRIQKICQNNSLSHYNFKNMFLNFTDNNLKSLVYKQVILAERQRQIQNRQQNYCLKNCIFQLAKVATKDFQFILELIISKSQDAGKDYVKYFREGLKNKDKELKQKQQAVVIVTDQNIWKTNNKNDVELSLQQYKSQQQIVKKIIEFKSQQKYKLGTLFIDFTKSSSTKQKAKEQIHIEIPYLIYLIQKSKNSLRNDGRVQLKNKIRIIVNYNRLKNQLLEIPFTIQYPIFSFDGSNTRDNDKEQTIFSGVKIHQIIQDQINKMDKKFDEFDDIQISKKMIQEFVKQVGRNNSSLSLACKKILLSPLEAKNIEAKNQPQQQSQGNNQKIAALKNPQYLKKYNSITTALTKQYFQKESSIPIQAIILKLAKAKILYNFANNSKLLMMSKIVNLDLNKIEIIKREKRSAFQQQWTNFMVSMSQKILQGMKKQYEECKKNIKNTKKQPNEINKSTELIIFVPTFCPYSFLQTEVLFSPQTIEQIKKLGQTYQQISKNFDSFKKNYQNKVLTKFKTKQLFRQYGQLISIPYMKKMFMLDIIMCILQKAEISSKEAYFILENVQQQLKCYGNQYLKKVVIILNNLDVWTYAFKIYSIFSENGMNKLHQGKKWDPKTFSQQIIKYAYKMISFTQDRVYGVKANNNLNDKLKVYTDIHHSVYSQIENMVNIKLIQPSDEYYQDMTITEQLISILEVILAKDPKINFSSTLKELSKKQTKVFNKLQKISEFLNTINDARLGLQKLISEYLANKLYPKWFKNCQFQEQVKGVFNKFYELCQKDMFFAHSSTSSIQIVLSVLQINYNPSRFIDSLKKLKQPKQNKYENIKEKLLNIMAKKCESNKHKDNLTVLFVNLIFKNLIRFSSLISDRKAGPTECDLERNFQAFTLCYKEILQGQNSVFKLVSFAFIRLYLCYYLEIARPENNTCIQIDKILSENNVIATNLRFYCLKILRKKLTAKQILERYIKLNKFNWCTLMKNQMKEEQSRAIEVPKIAQSMINNDLQNLMNKFKEFQGRDVEILDSIVDIGSTSSNGRYIIFNFFMKYIYTLAYNKQYQEKIIQHVKSKEAVYTQKLGKVEYQLLLRYTTSKFDQQYFVQKHQNFDQVHFTVFNNLNWMLATKQSKSPLHSLFFQNGNIAQSISKQIKQSYLPCGVQNPFILSAKGAIVSTKNCNVGVYICSNNCDFIYTHLGCGWPAMPFPCPMCGLTLGGKSHNLQRKADGARRLISEKFLDGQSILYVDRSDIRTYEQFWESQRCYIEAQINRIRRKQSGSLKVKNKNNVVIEQKFSLLGYNLRVQNQRISTVTSKVLMFIFDSLLYNFVSLQLIKPEQYQQLFNLNQKSQILKKLNENVKTMLEDIKKILNLDTKFYTWIFGIQGQIFMALTKFQKQFRDYIGKKDKHVDEICKKMQQRKSTSNNNIINQLYTDLQRVMKNGLITKQFSQVLANNQLNAKNQFSREVFEQFSQNIVCSYILEGKSAFVEARFQMQGKMQFPFDVMLTQSKLDQAQYAYSRVLKLPFEFLNFDQIANKYEFLIKQKHPILDYLLKNIASFNSLSAFNKVIKACNTFQKTINMKVTRNYCKSYKLDDFNKQMCDPQVNLVEFISSWKKISNFIGPVQIDCKFYGNMNNDVNVFSQLYNFLLDGSITGNACGKVMVGIYHNFANTHNDVINMFKTRKNLILKYRKMNLIVEDYKKNPQQILDEQFIVIKEQDIMQKILQASVPSIKYAQNLVYYNFDFCESYFLLQMKGKCLMQPQIKKYKSVAFVCEHFSGSIQNTKIDAISSIRQAVDNPIQKEKLKTIKQKFEDLSQLPKYQIYGELEQVVNKIGNCIDYLKQKPHQTLYQFIKNQFSNTEIDTFLGDRDISQVEIGQIVHLFETLQQQLRPTLAMKKAIPQCYRKPMQAQTKKRVVQLLQQLPKQPSEQNPTAVQLCLALRKYVFRNLMSEKWEQGKIFDFFLNAGDYWPKDYDIYKLMNIYKPLTQLVKNQSVYTFMEEMQKYTNL